MRGSLQPKLGARPPASPASAREGGRDRTATPAADELARNRPPARHSDLDRHQRPAPARPEPLEGARAAAADPTLRARASRRTAAPRHQEARPHRRSRPSHYRPRTGVINRHPGIGWEYLHVCVDDASRLAYTEILADERKESAVALPRPCPRLVRPLWRQRRARHDRQRQLLPQPPLPPSLQRRRYPTPAHKALYATDQWQELWPKLGDGSVKGGVSRWVEACLNLPKERYAMTSNSTVVPLCQSDAIDDPLTAILRSGARRLLAQAIEAEAETFLATMKGAQLPDGRERLVRHGLGPERVIQTGIGPVEVRRVKLRDRRASEGAERIRFTSSILPRWARRTPSLDALLPILYLRGVSMGEFQEALGALLGRDAPNLSPSVIARLRGEWEADYAGWQRRDLSARRYVYVW